MHTPWWRKVCRNLFARPQQPIKNTRKKRTRLGVEQLEDRVVPYSVNLTGNTLTITLEAASETIALTNDGTLIAGEDTTSPAADGFLFPTAAVNRIEVLDGASAGGQSLTLGGTTTFNLSNGFSSTGVETVTFNNSVNTSAGTGSVEVHTTASLVVNQSMTTGTGGVTLEADDQTISSTINTSGPISMTARNGITLNGAINAGSSTVSISANQDGIGAESLNMAAGSSIVTANVSTTAIVLRVNTAVGGAGNAAVTLLQTGPTGAIQVDVTSTGAGGAIVDTNGVAINFSTRDLVLKANTGIGAGIAAAFNGGELEATVSNFDASNATSGGIYLRNTGFLIIVDSALDTDSLGLVAAGGGRIEAASPLAISSNATIGASMALVAGDSAANDDDLTINSAAVITLNSAAALTLTVQAGDDIIFNTGSITSGLGAGPYTVNLNADNEGAGGGDTDRGGVTQTGATTSVTTAALNILAAEGIGSSAALPFRFNADVLTTNSTGLASPANQFLFEVNTATATSINAGAADLTLVSGTFKIGSGGGAISDNTDVTVNSPAVLDLNGNNDTIDALQGSGFVTNSLAASTGTLTVGNNNAASPTFTGVISEGSATALTALSKIGTGIQTLTNTNTYTGTTTVSGGTLRITGSLSTSATSLVNLTAAATLDGAGTGQILRPVVVTGTGSGAQITNLTVNTSNSATDGITIQSGANNVTVSAVTSTGNQNGINVAAVTGLQLTSSHFDANARGMLSAGDLTSTGSSFNNNTLAAGDGAGINVTAGSLTLSAATTISGNTATTGAGGGINNAGGIVTFLQTLPSALPFFNAMPAGVVSGNTAITGGGINMSSGILTMDMTTVAHNSATAGAGGGLNTTGGIATITNSTFSGNSATTTGGGINVSGGIPTLTNVTVSVNTAGGGLAVSGGIVSLVNNTIAFNTGNGVTRTGGIVSTSNTIFAQNSGFDYSGTITVSLGNNLIENSGGVVGTVVTDIVNQLARLAALANYGGPTETHALLPGSAALDRGAISSAATDQRGLARPVADPYDIGAYESRGFAITRTGVPIQNAPTLAAGGTLAIGVPVFYVITTVIGGAEVTVSNEQTITPNAGNQSVNLSWAGATGATGYKIYRANASGVYTNRLIATVGGGITNFTDTGLATGVGTPPETTSREVPVGDTKYRGLIDTTFRKSDGATDFIFDANVVSLDGLTDLTGGALLFVTPNAAGAATATAAAAFGADAVAGGAAAVVTDPINFKATTILLRNSGSNVFSNTFRAQAIVMAGAVPSGIGTSYFLFASASTLASTYAAGAPNNTDWRMFNQQVTTLSSSAQPQNTSQSAGAASPTPASPIQFVPPSTTTTSPSFTVTLRDQESQTVKVANLPVTMQSTLADPTLFGSAAVNTSANTVTFAAPHGLTTGQALVYGNGAGAIITGAAKIVYQFTPSNVNIAANTITFATPHGLKTGQALTYQNGGGTNLGAPLPVIFNSLTYYAIVVNPTTIKLALNPARALVNQAIDFTTRGSATQSLTPTYYAIKVDDSTIKLAINQVSAIANNPIALTSAGGAGQSLAATGNINSAIRNGLSAANLVSGAISSGDTVGQTQAGVASFTNLKIYTSYAVPYRLQALYIGPNGQSITSNSNPFFVLPARLAITGSNFARFIPMPFSSRIYGPSTGLKSNEVRITAFDFSVVGGVLAPAKYYNGPVVLTASIPVAPALQPSYNFTAGIVKVTFAPSTAFSQFTLSAFTTVSEASPGIGPLTVSTKGKFVRFNPLTRRGF